MSRPKGVKETAPRKRKEQVVQCEQCPATYKTKNKKPGVDGILRCKKCRLKRATAQRQIRLQEQFGTSSGWFAYAKNNPKYRQTRFEYVLKTYGLTLDQYKAILEQQKAVCAICKRDEPNGRLVIDHNHVTGKVRGLLCHKCNRSIGSFNDSVETIHAAATYLLQY